jgi:hypothetical protein
MKCIYWTNLRYHNLFWKSAPRHSLQGTVGSLQRKVSSFCTSYKGPFTLFNLECTTHNVECAGYNEFYNLENCWGLLGLLLCYTNRLKVFTLILKLLYSAATLIGVSVSQHLWFSANFIYFFKKINKFPLCFSNSRRGKRQFFSLKQGLSQKYEYELNTTATHL